VEIEARTMAVIEVVTFRLVPDVDESEFLLADQGHQTAFSYRQRGILRRTTARSGEDWLVVTTWESRHHADASAQAAQHDATVTRWTAFLEPSSVTTQRFDTLA